MADDKISEAGRQARFAQWEKLGLDEIKQDLATGGHRLIGGPPQVRALAREWVRMKEAELASAATTAMGLSKDTALDAFGLQATPLADVLRGEGPGSLKHALQSSASTTIGEPVPSETRKVEPEPEEKRAELLSLKPTIYGVGIDLKEAGRRIRRRFQRQKDKSE